MSASTSRIVVAVEPLMLADSLIRVLESRGIDVVIDLRGVGSHSHDVVFPDHFDAAVTTGDLPDDIEADLVIRLPGEQGGPIVARLQRGAGRFEVEIADLDACLELLDAFC